jgi:hypothetical protein
LLREQSRASRPGARRDNLREARRAKLRNAGQVVPRKTGWWFPSRERRNRGSWDAWRGHDRVIVLGPRAQEVLRPWLRLNLHENLFQPADGVADFRARQRAARKTKVQPSQVDRKKIKPKGRPRTVYTTSTYASAVGKAVLAANKAGPATNARIWSRRPAAARARRRPCRTGTPTNCGPPRQRNCERNSALMPRGPCWGTARRRSQKSMPRWTPARPPRRWSGSGKPATLIFGRC